MLIKYANFDIEKAKSAWNRESETMKPKYSLQLRRIASNAEEYAFEFDPNFDFENRDVEIKREDSMKILKEHKIKEYYHEVVDHSISEDNKNTINDTETVPKETQEPLVSAMDLLNGEKKFSEEVTTRKRKNTDYDLTKTASVKIGPSKMRPRAPFKLIEVCKENGYKLSMDDLEKDEDILGSGAFGEVYIVKCKLNHTKYALKILNKQQVKNKGFERHIMREKDIMAMLNHPNVLRLEHYFHDSIN